MAGQYAGGGGGGGGGGGWGDPAPQSNGVYWIGTNGQVYVKGGSGVNAAGAADGNTQNYWGSRGFTLIDDPNPGQAPATQNYSAGGGGGGSAGTAQDQADEQAYWQDQMGLADQQLARLPSQTATGEANIDNSYTSAYNRLVGDKEVTNRDYTTKRGQTVEDNITAKNNINTSVRNQNTALQRLLGSKGAGTSSAATVLAPYAAAKVGNQQRGQVQTAYGRNIQGLDTAWGDYEKDWGESAEDLNTQRTNQKNTLRSGIATTEASLQEQKANAAVQKAQAGGQNYATARNARAPYLARIQQLIGQIDSLGTNATFTPKTAAYKAPELASYTYDRYAAPTAGSGVDPNQAAGAGAYWTLLNGDKKKEQSVI